VSINEPEGPWRGTGGTISTVVAERCRRSRSCTWLRRLPLPRSRRPRSAATMMPARARARRRPRRHWNRTQSVTVRRASRAPPHLRTGTDDVVAGPIVFHGLKTATRYPADYRDRGGGRYASFKTVTEVTASAVVTVAVAPGERDLALNYDDAHLPAIARLSDLQRTVEFRACAASQRRFSWRGRVGPRTQFNGGFASAGPGCRTFYVFAARETDPIRVRVGFGTRGRPC